MRRNFAQKLPENLHYVLLYPHSQLKQQAAMAPKAEKKPAKKVAKTAKTGSKKKSRVKVESFKIYIYKVLKQVRRPGCSACACA